MVDISKLSSMKFPAWYVKIEPLSPGVKKTMSFSSFFFSIFITSVFINSGDPHIMEQAKEIFKQLEDDISKEQILRNEFLGDLKPFRSLKTKLNEFLNNNF